MKLTPINICHTSLLLAMSSTACSNEPREAVATHRYNVVSAGLNAEYFATEDLSGSATKRRDANIEFNWKDGSPGSGLPADHFSVRWTGRLQAPVSATYTFYPYTYDGSRLWIGNTSGAPLLDDWAVDEEKPRASIALQSGQTYDFKMEYHETSGAAVAQLFWAYPGQSEVIVPGTAFSSEDCSAGAGVSGEYYANETLSGTPIYRLDADINFNWQDGQPHPSVPADSFSVRWQGRITAPVSGSYTFFPDTFDGARLWIGTTSGTPLIEDWSYDEDTPSTTLTLTAGQAYDFKMEYREGSGAAVAKLLWTHPAQASKVPVPKSAFTTTSATCGEPPTEPPVEPLPGGAEVLFRDDFESASPSCWATKPTTGCGPYHYLQGPIAIKENGVRRSGNKAVELTFTNDEDEASSKLSLDESHVFFRYYDYFHEDTSGRFDFAAGMKVARFSGYDAPAQSNRFDLILVAAAKQGTDKYCGTNEMDKLVFHRQQVGFYVEKQPFAFTRGRWTSVETEVKLNTGTQANGEVRVFVDGRLMLERVGLSDVRNQNETMNINSIMVGGWYSNSAYQNPEWCKPASPQSRRYIDDIVLARKYIGPEPTLANGGSGQKLVAFTTPYAGTTQVEYGLTESYGSRTPLDTTLTQDHTATLNGLTPGATYHYRVRSSWSGYDYVSPDYVFVAP
jgi:hypothetical protein